MPVPGQFELVTQLPKPKTRGLGKLSIGQDGAADFFEGDAGERSAVLATMERVRIVWAAADGIKISGMEPLG